MQTLVISASSEFAQAAYFNGVVTAKLCQRNKWEAKQMSHRYNQI